MKRIRMYTTRWCPFCVMAKRLFASKGLVPEEVEVDADPDRRAEMMSLSGRRTVPQIFIGDQHIGGFEEVAALDRAGRLEPMLADTTDKDR